GGVVCGDHSLAREIRTSRGIDLDALSGNRLDSLDGADAVHAPLHAKFDLVRLAPKLEGYFAGDPCDRVSRDNLPEAGRSSCRHGGAIPEGVNQLRHLVRKGAAGRGKYGAPLVYRSVRVHQPAEQTQAMPDLESHVCRWDHLFAQCAQVPKVCRQSVTRAGIRRADTDCFHLRLARILGDGDGVLVPDLLEEVPEIVLVNGDPPRTSGAIPEPVAKDVWVDRGDNELGLEGAVQGNRYG